MKIQQKNFFCDRRNAWLPVVALLLLPGLGIAQAATLSNGGSTMTVDLNGSDGINSWTVDTSPVNQLDSEWFYYSINGGAAQPINALGLVNGTGTVTGGNSLNATYSNGQLSVQIGFTLQGSGSGSGSAGLTANILTVSSSTALTSLNVYEYANFNLLQTSDNSIGISPAYGGPPTFPIVGYNGVSQMNGSTALTEAIGTPYADYAEAGTYSTVLSDVATGHNLNDVLSTGPNSGVNVAWALEWSYQGVAANSMETVLSGQTLSIANVPEPSTMALIGLGLGAVGFIRRRKAS